MRIGVMRFSWVAALAASWGLTWVANDTLAQERGGKGILSGLTARRDAAKTEVNFGRIVEVQVELALMGDPITFPYFLEARVDGSRMELRGFVPDKSVQDHALKLARLNCPLAVVDGTRVHPSLAVRPTRLPPEKLAPSVERAISKTLPSGSKALKIHCDMDGKVLVTGNVKTLEEKLLVSQSLRRLHGCGCVVNATQVEGMAPMPTPHIAASPPPPARKTTGTTRPTEVETKPSGIVTAQAKEPARRPAAFPAEKQAEKRSEGPFGGFFSRLFGKKKADETPDSAEAPLPRFPTGGPREPVKITNIGTPAPKGTGWGTPPRPATVPATPTGKRGAATEPYEASGVIVTPGVESAPKKLRTYSPAQVKARLESTFPSARPIIVAPEGGKKLNVELTLRSSAEIDTVAGRLLALPELEAYDVNLSFRIDGPPAKNR